jgi:hypothetical protein
MAPNASQGGVHEEDRHPDAPHGAQAVDGGFAAIRQLQQEVTDDDQENRNRSDTVEVGLVCDRHRLSHGSGGSGKR